MIEPQWKRIAGVHFQAGAAGAGAVWIALDPQTDVAHLYDCALFPTEPAIIIAEGLNKHGKWIPIAWEKAAKPLADQLLDRGCNMLSEPVEQTDVQAEAASRDVLERMRSERFRVDRRMTAWLDEYRDFQRDEGKVPTKGHPLMAATRYAVANIAYARSQNRGRKDQKNYPTVAMI